MMSRAFYCIPIAFIFIFPCVVSRYCGIHNAVDLSGGQLFHDGTIVKDGVRFPPKHIYEQTGFDGTVKTYGCLCEVVACFRKCCPFGSVINGSTYRCVEAAEHDNITNMGLQVWYQNLNLLKTVDLRARTGVLGLLFGRPVCDSSLYPENEKGFYFQEDGRLFVEMSEGSVPFALRAADKYCMDTFLLEGRGRLDALVCFTTDPDNHNYLLSSVCMLVSSLFLLATLLVYGCLPELRNMHGRVLTGYLACLFVGFLCMATVQVLLLAHANYRSACIVMTFIIYYFLLSSFFWLNVMCFDIWWTFSGKRGLSLEKLSTSGRFVAYCAYAFGGPTALTALLALVEFCVTRSRFTPQIRFNGTCFLDSTARLLYFYLPILALCISNMVFFVLTAVRIAAVGRQAAVLKSGDSARHDTHHGDKQRLVLYVKIFTVMGVSWILEVASAVWPDWTVLWDITDTYNVLMGVMIFVIFVCKRKIFRLIKKRFKGEQCDIGDSTKDNEMVHKPSLAPRGSSIDTVKSTLSVDSTVKDTILFAQWRGQPVISRTQTTTSRTLSIRDEIHANSMNNPN